MRAGIVALVVAYVLSQFYRAFLAVLTPFLARDLGAGPEDLALSSGLWFLIFAAMQIPVGAALDTIGPRRSSAWLLGLAGGGGALIFALAQAPWHLHVAMGLIGIGCSPVLMAAYYIFGRTFAPSVFATLAGMTIGFGTLGNLAGAWPLAWAAETFGWRQTVALLAVVTVAVAVALAVLVRDPPPLDHGTAGKGRLRDVLRIRELWFLLPLIGVAYAPAGGLRGLWAGPFFGDVYGADAAGIGSATLIMALAMAVGAFAYGPLDRVFGTRKWVIIGGNALVVVCLLALWAWPGAGFLTATLLFAGVGFFGASYPMTMAHGRSLFPPHLLGRGVTLMNLFSIGGAGVLQSVTARVHGAVAPVSVTAPYQAIFLLFALLLTAGLVIYLFSTDSMD